MIVLALDTAMAACSAAVYDAAHDRVLAERFLTMSKGHADVIAPLIREVMEEAQIGFGAIGRIGVTIGPGTFTGVRTGLAMARGLGLSLAIPVVGLDTLTAIACNAASAEPVAVAADARRGEVYFALFGPNLTMLERPQVLPASEAVRRLPQTAVSILGTASELLAVAADGKPVKKSTAGNLPKAASFIRRIACMTPQAAMPEPLYLRPPDAKPQARFTGHRALLRIDRAGADMAGLLALLHAECFDNPWGSADMARLMAMPGSIALVASAEEEPCAFLIARRAADEAEILTLGTRPFARRQGAARALVAELQEQLAKAGTRALFIEVAAGNEPARKLYSALGFADAAKRKAYYEKPGGLREDAIVMRKELRA